MEVAFLVGFPGPALPGLLRAYIQNWIRHHPEGTAVLVSSDPVWEKWGKDDVQVLPPDVLQRANDPCLWIIGQEARAVWRHPAEIPCRCDWLLLGDREELASWWPQMASRLPMMAMGFSKIVC
jgi:hypothetical protein